MMNTVFQIKKFLLASQYVLQLLLVSLLLPTQGTATTDMTLKAGFIPSETFGSFQMDLLDHLTHIALEMDDVDLTFELTDIEIFYTSNLPLIGPDCPAGESIVIHERSYNCSDFDILVGDFWPNPT